MSLGRGLLSIKHLQVHRAMPVREEALSPKLPRHHQTRTTKQYLTLCIYPPSTSPVVPAYPTNNHAPTLTIASNHARNGPPNGLNRPSTFRSFVPSFVRPLRSCSFPVRAEPVNNVYVPYADFHHPSPPEWRRRIHPAMQAPRFSLLR